LRKSEAEAQYVATIEANIARFHAPEDSQKLKVVIAPLRLRSSAYHIGNDSVSALDRGGGATASIDHQSVDTDRSICGVGPRLRPGRSKRIGAHFREPVARQRIREDWPGAQFMDIFADIQSPWL
jgi:hypothetical protein